MNGSALPLTLASTQGYNQSVSDGTLAPSSSGQDRGFSALKPGFDSPWRYAPKGRVKARPLSRPAHRVQRGRSWMLSCQVAIGLMAIALHMLASHASAEAITMDEAVRSAMKHNADLRAARFARDAARTEADRDRPAARPRLTIEAEALAQTPKLTFPRGVEEATVRHTRYGRIGVTLDQPIYRAGARDAWTRHSAMALAADAVLERERNDIIRSVRKSFARALTAKGMLGVAREGADLAVRHRALVTRMIEAGLAAPLDGLTADADLAEATDGLTRAENGLKLALADLCRLTGLPADTPSDRLAMPAPLAEYPNEADLLRSAIASRPELQALRHGIAAASAGIALARTQTTPELSVRASLVRQTPSAFTSRDWAGVGIAAVWPVLDGGKAASDVRAAQARVGELRAKLEAAEAGVRLEVRSALSGIRTAHTRIGMGEGRLKAARSALAIAELRYEQRATTLLEVAAARLAVTKAAAALTEAQGDLMLAEADLRYSAALDIASSGASAP